MASRQSSDTDDKKNLLSESSIVSDPFIQNRLAMQSASLLDPVEN